MVQSAKRLLHTPWASPRFIAGVSLVLASALVGAIVVASMSRTEKYWTLVEPVRAGQSFDSANLVLTDARMGSKTSEELFAADDDLPGNAVWTIDLGAGALVPHSALQAPTGASHQLPVAVHGGSFPADLAAGDVVDLWVGPGEGDTAGTAARRVLAAARVHSLGAPGLDERTIVLDLSGAPEPSVVGDIASRHVTIVRVS